MPTPVLIDIKCLWIIWQRHDIFSWSLSKWLHTSSVHWITVSKTCPLEEFYLYYLKIVLLHCLHFIHILWEPPQTPLRSVAIHLNEHCIFHARIEWKPTLHTRYIPSGLVFIHRATFRLMLLVTRLGWNVDGICRSMSYLMLTWVRFNVKMSYQYRNFQYKDETVSQPSHLYNGNSYTSETVSWYWVGPMATCIFILQQPWHGMGYVWSAVFYEEEFQLPAPYGCKYTFIYPNHSAPGN